MDDSFKNEATRLRSFINWPKENVVPAADLAREGFYYMGHDDKVKCAFCDLILTQWEPGDTSSEQHRKWCPKCPFVLGENVGNIRISVMVGENVQSGSLQTNKAINSKLISKDLQHHEFEVTKLECESAEKRRNTFRNWHGYQKPEEMALAGFFYTGTADEVYCYACKRGLAQWQQGEDPWIEHVRWSPKCSHVLSKKGPDFIHYLVQRFESSQANSALSVLHVTEMRLEAEQHSLIFKRMKEMGFDEDEVNKVLRLKIVNTNSAFENELDFIQAIHNYQESIRTGKPASMPTSKQATTPSLDAEALARENAMLRDMRLCKICMDNEINVLLKPCKHACICSNCEHKVSLCPMCRTSIKGTEKFFLS